MRNMKKWLATALALVMVFAMAACAVAATVTVADDAILSGHSFTAYQIFSGREEGGVLSDVQWGSGIDSTAFLSALQADTNFSSCATAADVANVLSAKNTDTALANAFAKLAYKHKSGDGVALTSGKTELADGYYLVVDTTENVGEGGAYNAALLQVVGNINITAKTDAPTVEKKVLEDDKYNENGGYGNGYNDVADYNMGDAVPFHLIGSVPDMSRYDTYKYTFHDTLSAGLTAPAKEAVKVYLSADKTLDASDSDVTSSFTVEVSGQKITVYTNDLKSVVGTTGAKYVIVAYTAVLNQSAVVGLEGNPNEVYLEYSNKPDQSGSGDTGNTGNTPEDKVIVFTYELDTTKVDGQDNTKKLASAEFVLYRKNGDTNEYAVVNGEGKVTKWEQATTAEVDGTTTVTYPEGSKLTSDANGLFKVIGLDDGTYYLKETQAPAGYNLLSEDITVIITATTKNGQDWTDYVPSHALTALAVTADGKAGTGDTSSGIAGITVANNKGSTLPETGGMGTTVLYVGGGVLVLAAVVLLIAKRRSNA